MQCIKKNIWYYPNFDCTIQQAPERRICVIKVINFNKKKNIFDVCTLKCEPAGFLVVALSGRNYRVHILRLQIVSYRPYSLLNLE